MSNIRIARDALRPRPQLDPQIISVRVGPLSERQAFALANLVTMTPGTLSLSIDPHRDALVIHTLYGATAASLAEHIRSQYVARVKAVF